MKLMVINTVMDTLQEQLPYKCNDLFPLDSPHNQSLKDIGALRGIEQNTTFGTSLSI
jgi:hypothetical protein